MPGMVRRAGPGGCPAAGKSRSDRRAGRAAGLRVLPGRVSVRAVWRGGLGLVAAAAVVLAVQPAVLASSAPAPTWTKQAPAASPPGRFEASMAYDAATGTVVLFGGYGPGVERRLGGTWTWDGSTWTKQSPAASPPARSTRRWPTTRPPAPSSCSAASASKAVFSVTPGPGTARPGPSRRPRPARPPGRRGDGLRRGHRHHRLVRRLQPSPASSVTPGPGTARPGPSRRPQPARPPGTTRHGLRRGHRHHRLVQR